MTDVVQIPKVGERPKFKFQLEGDDQVWELPMLQHLPKPQLIKLRELSLKLVDGKGKPKKNLSPKRVEEAARVQQDILDEYCPGLYTDLAEEQLAWLMEAWRDASEISLGESSASSTS